MLKSITDTFRSFFTSSINNTDNIPVGSKRKRNRQECDDYPDVQVIRVEKKRRVEPSDTTSFVSSLSRIPSRMAEWISKQKSKRYSEEFHTRPVESSYRWGNTPVSQGNGDPKKVVQLNGDEKQPVNHRFEARHNISHFKDIHRNGENEGERNNQSRFGISRRSSNSSSIFRNSRQSTASQCIRLKERKEYEKLLQLHSLRSPWQPAVPVTVPTCHKSHSSASPESDVISISSKSSSGDESQLFRPNRTHQHLSSIPRPRITTSHHDISSSGRHLRHGKSAAARSLSLSLLLEKQRKKAGSNVSHQNAVNAGHHIVSQNTNQSCVRNQTASVIPRDDNVKSNNKGLPTKKSSDTIIIDDDEDENISNQNAASQKVIPIRDSNEQSHGAHSSTHTSFLHSKYLNDTAMEDERKSRQEEQERRKREMEEAELKMKAYAEKRRAQELTLERDLKYKMRIFDEEPEVSEEIFREEEEEEEEEETLPELTDEMENVIRVALRPGNPNEVLSEGYRLQITRRDMATLCGLSWLNDEVGQVGKPNWLNDQIINFYMNMLTERGEKEGYPKVYAFNTFFYPKIMKDGHSAVRRWTKNVDIFAKDYIIIPVHLGMHWCLCVVSIKKKEILYYDSMGARNDDCLHAVLKYLNDESVAKKQVPIKQSEWKLINIEDNPQQMNGGDCGMFMCKYAEYITRGKEITFTQEDMPYFRRRMVYEIVTKKLLQ